MRKLLIFSVFVFYINGIYSQDSMPIEIIENTILSDTTKSDCDLCKECLEKLNNIPNAMAKKERGITLFLYDFPMPNIKKKLTVIALLSTSQLIF